MWRLSGYAAGKKGVADENAKKVVGPDKKEGSYVNSRLQRVRGLTVKGREKPKMGMCPETSVR